MQSPAVVVPELRLVAHAWSELSNVWWVFLAEDGSWRFLDRVGGEDQASAIEHLKDTAARLGTTAELKFHSGKPPTALNHLVPGRQCSDEPRALILGMVN